MDHVAAALERLHALEQRRLAVQNADAGRAAQLVAGERVEIAIQVLHVDRQVRRRLRAVDQHRHAARMRERDHLFDRVDAAQRVGDMRRRRRSRVRSLNSASYSSTSSSPASLIGTTRIVAPFSCGQHLPGHDVGVVLQHGQDDFVAGADELAAPAVHHQVDASVVPLVKITSRSSRALMKRGSLHARLLVGGGRDLRQVMHARGGCSRARWSGSAPGGRSPAAASGSMRRCRGRPAACRRP